MISERLQFLFQRMADVVPSLILQSYHIDTLPGSKVRDLIILIGMDDSQRIYRKFPAGWRRLSSAEVRELMGD